MIVADGYMKVLNSPYREKQYKAWLIMPGGIDRVTRRYFRTAGKAIEYGKRLAERYNRMFAEENTNAIHETGGSPGSGELPEPAQV